MKREIIPLFYAALARPKHWLKNALVFVPLLYARSVTDLELLWAVSRCFAAFCLISSAVYTVNDIADAERDRRHPLKKLRPVAAGRIPPKRAAVFAAVLFTAGFAASAAGFGHAYVFLFAVLYAAVNLTYSVWLKHVAVADCFCIAAGFVFRIYAGGAAGSFPISEWLFLTMAAVSLFLAFGKRRGEIMQVSDSTATRKVLGSYGLPFLNGMMFVCAGLSVVFYSLWAMVSAFNAYKMVYTVPLVIFIVCKYLLAAHKEGSLGDPTSILLEDKSLLAASAAFVLLTAVLLYCL